MVNRMVFGFSFPSTNTLSLALYTELLSLSISGFLNPANEVWIRAVVCVITKGSVVLRIVEQFCFKYSLLAKLFHLTYWIWITVRAYALILDWTVPSTAFRTIRVEYFTCKIIWKYSTLMCARHIPRYARSTVWLPIFENHCLIYFLTVASQFAFFLAKESKYCVKT